MYLNGKHGNFNHWLIKWWLSLIGADFFPQQTVGQKKGFTPRPRPTRLAALGSKGEPGGNEGLDISMEKDTDFVGNSSLQLVFSLVETCRIGFVRKWSFHRLLCGSWWFEKLLERTWTQPTVLQRRAEPDSKWRTWQPGSAQDLSEKKGPRAAKGPRDSMLCDAKGDNRHGTHGTWMTRWPGDLGRLRPARCLMSRCRMHRGAWVWSPIGNLMTSGRNPPSPTQKRCKFQQKTSYTKILSRFRRGLELSKSLRWPNFGTQFQYGRVVPPTLSEIVCSDARCQGALWSEPRTGSRVLGSAPRPSCGFCWILPDRVIECRMDVLTDVYIYIYVCVYI